MKYITFLLLLFPVFCLSQTLSGKVSDAITGKPVPDASVFFSNATIGTKSAGDGSFVLRDIRPGQYDLVISVVGYEPYKKQLLISSSVTLPEIKLVPKTMQMQEVRIAGKDPKRDRKLKLFKRQFLGESAFARNCTIVNPDVLTLTFSKHEKVLTATTADFLEVDNDALGYKLKYLVDKFVLDFEDQSVGYQGSVLFEQKTGKPADTIRWAANRRKAYLGSPTHFLREVLANRVDSNFMVRRFCIARIDTNDKVPGGEGDAYYFTHLKYDTLHTVHYVHATDRRGIYAIRYPDEIDVFYYARGTLHYRSNRHDIETGNRGR